MTENLGWIAWWLCAAVQLVGLWSAWLTRLRAVEGERGELLLAWRHGLFLASLAAVAGLTMVAVAVGDGTWIAPAATLAIMILAATCDFRQASAVAG